MATSVSEYYVAIWILQKKSLHYLLEIEVATFIPPHRLVIKILFHKKRSKLMVDWLRDSLIWTFIHNHLIDPDVHVVLSIFLYWLKMSIGIWVKNNNGWIILQRSTLTQLFISSEVVLRPTLYYFLHEIAYNARISPKPVIFMT